MSEVRSHDEATGDRVSPSTAFGRRSGDFDARGLAKAHSEQTLQPPAGAPRPRSWSRFRALASRDHARFRNLLADLRTALERCYESLPSDQRGLSGAQRWLYDNDYLVWQALRMTQRDLPPGFHRRLPQLTSGETRIVALTGVFLAASPAGARLPALSRFLTEYQKVTPLDLAELWALPTFLRVAALGSIVNDPDDEGAVADAVLWLHTIEQHDWGELVEGLSVVERLLAQDPAGHYRRMDDATRDQYRKAVERLARRSGRSQLEVCEAALAAAGAAGGPDRHVGIHLLGVGSHALERRLLSGGGIGARLARFARRQAGALYLLLMIAVAVVVAAPIFVYAAAVGVRWLAPLVILALAAPVWLAAEALVHRLIAVLASPRFLPKLDLSRGVPVESRTMV
ncbi:MAG TPA: hypothetical protein VFD39_06135, partial [Trueperaceae bacterium]|nr:hypothetical protein [Trueperaceae bacterium]